MTIRGLELDVPGSAQRLAELEVHVRYRLSGRVRDFRLEPGEKGLVLRGQSRTFYAKQLAQHAVMEAARLPIAANAIEVCG
jgi:hypothetical protein